MKLIVQGQGRQALLDSLAARSQLTDKAVTQTVERVIADVRQRGDEAVLDYTARFDGASLTADTLRVSQAEIDEAYAALSEDFLRVLRRSAASIRQFHARQVEQSWFAPAGGGMVGQMVLPLESCGVYAPGGTAAYPSTVLMNVIPAKVAGVGRIVMATPPGKDGKANPATLVAAVEAGADEIYKMGGAQAIAALAFGTKTIARVDKITGPGNAYVANAKRQVFGFCGIDSFAGPSEVLVVADDTARADWVAADLLSQAEHDKNAAAILVTTSEPLARAVVAEVEKQLAALPRESIARQAMETNGAAIVASSAREAMDIANRIAPEHLELCVEQPHAYMGLVKHAGAVFMGHFSPEPLGDYYAGPNHTLPTSGTARFFSPLSVQDFTKKTSVIEYDRNGLEGVWRDVAAFARQEGLEAHARSISIRFEGEKT
nr:histidinol dehydrogenase [bacterium]